MSQAPSAVVDNGEEGRGGVHSFTKLSEREGQGGEIEGGEIDGGTGRGDRSREGEGGR